MTSSDGFCSNLTFNPGELGQVYAGHVPTAHHPSPAISAASSAQPTPTPTPTTSSAPSFEKNHAPHITVPVSPAPIAQPLSPTRSNSTSSIVTQPSQSHNPASVITSNPTPTMSNVPSVAASNSSFASLSWTTPPQTPMPGAASTTSSVGGSILGKRDTSESEKEDHAAIPKKRRIAPTLIGNDRPGGQ